MTAEWITGARERLRKFYDEIRRILRGQVGRAFPTRHPAEIQDRADEAAALVAISVLSSRSSTRLLATTAYPLAYMLKCGRNQLRHAPPKKSTILLRSEPINLAGTTPSGVAPARSGIPPLDLILLKEVKSEIALYPQPKRAIFVLWMHGFTSGEIARTIRVTAANARYHISRIRAELRRRSVVAA